MEKWPVSQISDMIVWKPTASVTAITTVRREKMSETVPVQTTSSPVRRGRVCQMPTGVTEKLTVHREMMRTIVVSFWGYLLYL